MDRKEIEADGVEMSGLDAMLASEEEITPSSGFLSAVMERVEEEASAPPPIPFPWMRALPGIAVVVGVFGWMGVELVRVGVPAIGQSLPELRLAGYGADTAGDGSSAGTGGMGSAGAGAFGGFLVAYAQAGGARGAAVGRVSPRCYSIAKTA